MRSRGSASALRPPQSLTRLGVAFFTLVAVTLVYMYYLALYSFPAPGTIAFLQTVTASAPPLNPKERSDPSLRNVSIVQFFMVNSDGTMMPTGAGQHAAPQPSPAEVAAPVSSDASQDAAETAHDKERRKPFLRRRFSAKLHMINPVQLVFDYPVAYALCVKVGLLRYEWLTANLVSFIHPLFGLAAGILFAKATMSASPSGSSSGSNGGGNSNAAGGTSPNNNGSGGPNGAGGTGVTIGARSGSFVVCGPGSGSGGGNGGNGGNGDDLGQQSSPRSSTALMVVSSTFPVEASPLALGRHGTSSGLRTPQASTATGEGPTNGSGGVGVSVGSGVLASSGRGGAAQSGASMECSAIEMGPAGGGAGGALLDAGGAEVVEESPPVQTRPVNLRLVRIGCFLFAVRNFLDTLDGVIARLRRFTQHEKEGPTAFGINGHTVDAVTDVTGVTCCVIGILVLIQRRGPVVSHVFRSVFMKVFRRNTKWALSGRLVAGIGLVFIPVASALWERTMLRYSNLFDVHAPSNRAIFELDNNNQVRLNEFFWSFSCGDSTFSVLITGLFFNCIWETVQCYCFLGYAWLAVLAAHTAYVWNWVVLADPAAAEIIASSPGLF